MGRDKEVFREKNYQHHGMPISSMNNQVIALTSILTSPPGLRSRFPVRFVDLRRGHTGNWLLSPYRIGILAFLSVLRST